MSFSFHVSGHAGQDVQNTDEDEGRRVRDLISDILDAAHEQKLELQVHSVVPDRWAPAKTSTY
jgi:hypothetical protein